MVCSIKIIMRVYLDNAATTPLTNLVKEDIIDVMNKYHGNPSSIHFHGRTSRSKIEASRKTIARLINASVGEIFFNSSATEGTNQLLTKSIEDLSVKHLVISPDVHPCILNPAIALSNKNPNVKLSYVKVDNTGKIIAEDLINILKSTNEKTLVSVLYANNELGTINDMNSISNICMDHGALLHCDAVQYIGKRNIDLNKLKVSFLTATGHKFHAPKGIGFIYMNSENIIGSYIKGGAQERNMRAGTENIIGISALATALEESYKLCKERVAHHRALKKYMIDKINQTFNDVIVNGSTDTEQSMDHILNLSFPPSDKAELLMFNLDIAGVCASSGSACSSGIAKDSHVLKAINHPPNRKAIRFSFSHFNTFEEIDFVIEVLKKNVEVD
jgi:cysteine desulfurase